jgi:predicted enzyme related to lactoylglutathione lyase
MAIASSMKVRGMDAAYYTVKDLEKATQFYTNVLGSEPTMAFPGSVSEWTFPGNETFGLYQSPEGLSSGSGVMFAVDDVQAAVDLCKSMGVEFDGAVDETPVCHMAFAKDPEGNRFILHKRK